MSSAPHIIWLTCLLCLSCEAAQAHRSGFFFGDLHLEPQPDGIHMKVLETYSYADSQGHVLSAQPGFMTDGASIPRPLWSVVGSPFTGKYIGAAVIHDVGCVYHKYTWEITDRMFYDAMLDLGVGDHLAKVMYFGVMVGGPRWELVKITAHSDQQLKSLIRASGAVSVTETSGVSGSEEARSASVVIPYARRTLSKQELEQFDKELRERESKGQTITLQEIEGRTSGPRPPLPPGAKLIQ